MTATFPKEELYGLISQIRRSCASIPANIAEGCGRGERLILRGFFTLRLGRQVSLNTISCLLMTLSF
jgi:hypothetical protein